MYLLKKVVDMERSSSSSMIFLCLTLITLGNGEINPIPESSTMLNNITTMDMRTVNSGNGNNSISNNNINNDNDNSNTTKDNNVPDLTLLPSEGASANSSSNNNINNDTVKVPEVLESASSTESYNDTLIGGPINASAYKSVAYELASNYKSLADEVKDVYLLNILPVSQSSFEDLNSPSEKEEDNAQDEGSIQVESIVKEESIAEKPSAPCEDESSAEEEMSEQEKIDLARLEQDEHYQIIRARDPSMLQRVKGNLLNLLGLPQRPMKVQKTIRIPKQLKDMYEKQSGNAFETSNLYLPGKNVKSANTVRSFYVDPVSSKAESTSPWDTNLKFNLDSIPRSEIVTGADLRIPFTITVNHDSEEGLKLKSLKVLIHDILVPVTSPKSKKPKHFHLVEAITHPMDVKTVEISKRQNGTSTFYLTFDVFPAVSRWIVASQKQVDAPKRKTANHGLLVEIFGLTHDKEVIPQDQVQRSHNLRIKRDVMDESPSLSSSTTPPPSERVSAAMGMESSTSSSLKTNSSSSSTVSAKNTEGTEVGAASAVSQQNDEDFAPKASTSTRSPPPAPIVLFTYSDDGKNRKPRDATTLSRQYRAAMNQRKRKGHRNKNRKRNLCARHSMFVDFTDVGWNDWIVAPPGYEAHHCAGECAFPMADHLNATNHAVIQALVHSINPGLVPPPCCTPTKYSSLSLLYTDPSDKIVLKNYNEMVVDSCGCS